MNPLSNPLFFFWLTYHYLNGVDRLKKYTQAEIHHYQDKSLRNIVRNAYTVPLYHEKYKKAGVHPLDIRGIKDIKKLPIITKTDLRNAIPQNLIPAGKKIDNFSKVTTSGSTGRPVTVFSESYTIFQTFIGFIRSIKEHGINWRKNKIAIIADLSQDSAEYQYFSKTAMPSLNTMFSLDNMKIYHVGEKPETIMRELERFNPEFVGSYPGLLKILAIFKKEGKADKLNPAVLASSGAILDQYTRDFIENSFNACVFDVYGATECSPIAFECQKGKIHINSDFVFIEYFNSYEKEEITGDGGNILVTRLFGRGTPILRYSGLSDFLFPAEEECDCEIHSEIIRQIGGRHVDSIVLSNGDLVPPSSLTGIPHQVMSKYDVDIIQQFQIIQHDINDIEMIVVLDKKYDLNKEFLNKIFNELKTQFCLKLGNETRIRIHEVDKIDDARKNSSTPPPVVLSKIQPRLY